MQLNIKVKDLNCTYVLGGVGVIFVLLLILNDTMLEYILVGITGILLAVKKKGMVILKKGLSSFWVFLTNSKVSILLYLKAMTTVKLITLTVKRFLIDNILSKWLQKNVIDILKPSFSYGWSYYRNLNFKTKLKKLLYFLVPTGAAVTLLQFAGMLDNVLIFAELKTLVIGFFKVLWIVLGKVFVPIFSFLTNSWITPILEIFALSWLLTFIEKRVPVVGPFIAKTLQKVVDLTILLFSSITDKIDTWFGGKINKHIRVYTRKFNRKMRKWINDNKVKHELEIVSGFIKNLKQYGICKYFGMQDYSDIKADKYLYETINTKTNDHLDIKAYWGDTVCNEVLILEGLATCNVNGIFNKNKRLKLEDFWVVNNTDQNLHLTDNRHTFTKLIPAHSIRLVKMKHDVNFKDLLINYTYRFVIVKD